MLGVNLPARVMDINVQYLSFNVWMTEGVAIEE